MPAVCLRLQLYVDGRDVKNRVNRAMRDPAALLEWAQERDEKDARTTEDEDDAGKVRQAEMSWSDQAARLNWEIAECVRADDNYSPLVTKVRAYDLHRKKKRELIHYFLQEFGSRV